MVALFGLQSWLWPEAGSPETTMDHIVYWGSVVWFGPLYYAVSTLAGLLWFRHPEQLDDVKPINKLVAWRIVSRGTNVEALSHTIARCHAEMAKTPLFPYVVEVVIDQLDAAMPPPNENLRYIKVPDDYQTPNKSLYKARALHYATEYSPLPDDAWIVHLDEESHPTASGIKGVCAMIQEEEASGALRIGQGAIVYHRKWREHPILTLADMLRTGDDFGRFNFQHGLGITLFGLHGSYIVARNDVVKSIGFDFGPQGSITEDAFWALVAMERGYRCRWVDGYIEEQSTESAGDFVRQRRRWYQGLVKVVLYAPVRLRWRLPLGLNTFFWTLAPFGILYFFVQFFYGLVFNGFVHEGWILFLANFSFSLFISVYMIGLKANLDEHGIQGWLKRMGWYIAQLVLFPYFVVLETAGVLAGVLRPVAGFHVVKK
jgi:egghead protein (zeste-white 4 protein)